MQPEKVEARTRLAPPRASVTEEDRPNLDNATSPTPQGFFNSPYGMALEQIEWGLPSELQSQWLIGAGSRVSPPHGRPGRSAPRASASMAITSIQIRTE